MTRPLPTPTPETAPYWAAAAEGVLKLPRCTACGWTGHRGRPVCPQCTGTDLEWCTASGEATLWSYVIVHRGEPEPYVVAIVELAEGPRMTTNLVGVAPDPALLELDMPLQVTFERGVPVFTPVGSAR